jgi:hypothetical protein
MQEPSEEAKALQGRMLEGRMRVWEKVRSDASTYLGVRFDPRDCDYMPMASISEAIVSVKLDIMNERLRRIMVALEGKS